MARTLWKGAINFGLVTIPISLYPATKARELSIGAGPAPEPRKPTLRPTGAPPPIIKVDAHQVDARHGVRLARGASLSLVVAAAAVIAIVVLRRPDRTHDPIAPMVVTVLQAEVDVVRADRDRTLTERADLADQLQQCRGSLASGVEGELRRKLDAALDDAAGLEAERDRLQRGLEAAQRDGKQARTALDQATAHATDQDARYGQLHDVAVKLCRKLGPARCPPETLPK